MMPLGRIRSPDGNTVETNEADVRSFKRGERGLSVKKKKNGVPLLAQRDGLEPTEGKR